MTISDKQKKSQFCSAKSRFSIHDCGRQFCSLPWFQPVPGHAKTDLKIVVIVIPKEGLADTSPAKHALGMISIIKCNLWRFTVGVIPKWKCLSIHIPLALPHCTVLLPKSDFLLWIERHTQIQTVQSWECTQTDRNYSITLTADAGGKRAWLD